MNLTLCRRFGFDEAGIAERLAQTGLGPADVDLLEVLRHEVIEPGLDIITEDFTATLAQDPEFLRIVDRHSDVVRLKTTLRNYLRGIGRDFGSAHYFEDRLAVGSVHQRVGVSLSRYHCAFRLLQSLLISRIPDARRHDPATFEALVQLVIKITALDMSLATDAYHGEKFVRLEQSLDTIRHEGEKLRRSLRTDGLTGLASRQHAIERLRLALERTGSDDGPPCVIMADLDNFKTVNDRYGHLVGDRVLQVVAKRVMTGAREQDVVGRFGGEEFIMVLEGTSLADATLLAERMRHNVGIDPVKTPDASIRMTISMGVAIARAGETVEAVTDRADRLLYEAKLAGRDCIRTEQPGPEKGSEPFSEKGL